MKRLESDSKGVGKKGWICPCGARVKRLKRLQGYIKRDKAISKLKTPD